MCGAADACVGVGVYRINDVCSQSFGRVRQSSLYDSSFVVQHDNLKESFDYDAVQDPGHVSRYTEHRPLATPRVIMTSHILLDCTSSRKELSAAGFLNPKC